MKSNVQLSWQVAPEISSSSDLVLEDKTKLINSSDLIEDRTWKETYWLKNLGRNIVDIADPVAYNCGFYLEALPTYRSLDVSLPEILSWSSIVDEEDDLPCGAFTIFGFDETDQSYIDRYNSGSLTIDEMYMFCHNWIQGSSRINQINLEVAKRYLTTSTYKQDSNLEGIVESHTANIAGEKSGVLKVMFVIRVPKEVKANRLSFSHKIGYDEKA